MESKISSWFTMHTKLNLRHVWKHYATRNKRKSMGETRGKDLEVNEWCWKMFSSNVWVWVWMWMWEHTFYWKCTFHQPSKCSALKMANRNCTLLSNIPCIWQTEIQNEMRWKLQTFIHLSSLLQRQQWRRQRRRQKYLLSSIPFDLH